MPSRWRKADAGNCVIALGEPPAALPAEFVRRPELVERLRTDGPALAVMVAPPGYGKSSLLADWAEHEDRPFVWLRVSSGRSVRDPLSSLTWPTDLRSACVAVLDDAHLLTPTALRAVVEGVLSDLPSDSMLALAGRSEPRLPIGRLRAHRAVTELRTADLAMTPDEAEVLLEQAGCGLEPTEVEELVRRTEGWPAALYIASLSLREHPEDGIEFNGADHLFSEYLDDEVLSGLSPETLTFAQRSSVLDELSGEVCDWVLGDRGAGSRLAALARSCQLLEPLDAARDWYRWHPLIRESLRGELRRTDPQEELELQRRASSWFTRRGSIDRAVKHACAGRDAQRAGDLLSRQIVLYTTTGRAEEVRRWLEPFGDEEIADDPRLAMCAALGSLATGDLDRARRCAGTAAAVIEQRRDKQPDAAIAAGLAVIEAVGARAGGAAMRNAADSAYEVAPPASEWRPVALALRGVAEHLIGEGEAAAVSLEAAIDLSGTALPGLTALCMSHRSMIAMEQADWDLVTELTDAGTAILLERDLADDPMMALVFAASAACRAHEGRSDEAKRDLGAGVGLLMTLGDSITWYGAEARILLAHASLWLADVVGARALLAQASRLARRTADATVFARWFDDAWAQMDKLAETSLVGPSALTIAELRILRFLPTHRSFREIGAQLGVSANTVKTQAHAIYRKLSVASRSEAVESAAAAGLLGQ